jgi:MATE family multidrug resistance protein
MIARPGGRPAPEAVSLPLSRHIARSLRLAVPVMLARAGLIIMITVDSMMSGRAGAEALAHYAISLAPHITLLVIGIGLMVGTMVLTAQADGAGRTRDTAAIWITALAIAGGLGTAGGVYVATSFFLEGLGRPHAGMAIALIGNLPNAALNWVLIYGHLGLPEMGAAGAALATTITRWFMLFALIGYALSMRGRARYGIGAGLRARFDVTRKLLRIGVPLSLGAGLETACFATVTTFAGRLGEVPLARYQIAFNVVTFVFMLAIGLSNATSIRVANAVGRGDRPGMALAGWTGVGLVVALTAAIGLLIGALGAPIAALYSNEGPVLALAAPALGVVAVLVVADGAQAVVLGALRGTGDVLFPMASYAVAFWLIAAPAAYVLGLEGGSGIVGLLWGLFAGLVCALCLLSWRFAVVARRAVEPV